MPPRLSPATLLAILQPWAEVNEPIHRRLAQLLEAESEQEVLWVGCGSGASVLWWARKFRNRIAGVDPDARAVEVAERAAREAGLAAHATFQTVEGDELPHEARVFDAAIVHMLYLPEADGATVLKESGRVVRPMGPVVALVPSWLSTPTESDARAVATLRLAPRMLVEWKSLFREADIVELSVEDATKDGAWMTFGWLGLVVRGWRAAGWAGVRVVLGRHVRALRSMALRRVLGLSIIKGTVWPHS